MRDYIVLNDNYMNANGEKGKKYTVTAPTTEIINNYSAFHIRGTPFRLFGSAKYGGLKENGRWNTW